LFRINITILTANLIRWTQEPGWLLLPLIPVSIFNAEMPAFPREYTLAA